MSKCFGNPSITLSELNKEQERKKSEAWDIDFATPEDYIKFKLKMLRKDMLIEPTEEELAHLNSLKTMGDIDRAVLSIINRRWDR